MTSHSMHRVLPGLFAVSLLAGCGTAPLSLLENRPFHRTHLHREPLTIVSVNGDYTSESPRRVYPGLNTLVLEARPAGGQRLPRQQTLAFAVAPCTRYYLAAERTTALSPQWTLVVDREEPVTGCTPEEELAKARREGVPPGPIATRSQTGNTP